MLLIPAHRNSNNLRKCSASDIGVSSIWLRLKLTIEATKDQSLFITDRNAAMIFFKYVPNENVPF